MTPEQELEWLRRVDAFEELKRRESRAHPGERRCKGLVGCIGCGHTQQKLGIPCESCGTYLTASNSRRSECGTNLAEQIISLPFDGQEYTIVCPRCGLTFSVTRPGPITEEDLVVYGL